MHTLHHLNGNKLFWIRKCMFDILVCILLKSQIDKLPQILLKSRMFSNDEMSLIGPRPDY
jgi:lipopolysaccharide/colanic/teichoic acid biosynthesis glycosyltransferase